MPAETPPEIKAQLIADASLGLYDLGALASRHHIRRLATVSKILDRAGVDIVAVKRNAREQMRKENKQKKEERMQQDAYDRLYNQLQDDEPLVEAAMTGLYSLRTLAAHFEYTSAGVRSLLKRNALDLSVIVKERKHCLERLATLLLTPQHSLVTLLTEHVATESGMRRYYEDLADYCQSTLHVGRKCVGKAISVCQLADFLEARDAGFSYHDAIIYAGFTATREQAHKYYSALRHVAKIAAPYLA